MRLVYCILDISKSGGTERTVLLQASHFAEHGNEVHIVTTEDIPKFSTFYKCSNKIYFHCLHINYRRVDGNLSLFAILRRIILGKKHKSALTSLLYEIKPDFTFSMFGHELSFLFRIKDGSKKIVEFHFFRYFRDIEFKNNSSSLLRFLFAKFKEWRKWKFINKYDAFVVLTDDDAKNWNFVKNLYVIPNALPEQPNVISDCLQKRIISVGRLTPQKGYDLLLNVWKIVSLKHSDWILDIFGEGECFEKLEKQIMNNNIKNCFINKPKKNIFEEYAKSSIYVLTSRYEGFGIVLIEAMSCGVPCISFDCPHGPSEIISDGNDGFIVPNGNIEEMASRICYLIENSEMRVVMGKNARKNVNRYFVDNVMVKWENLLNDLLKKK